MEINACDWKLYVHCGTLKNTVDILGTCYILCELDVYVSFYFHIVNLVAFKWVCKG